MNHPEGVLLEEINKRLTLNLLIQGSAEHAFLTTHYLVRDEISAINPSLIRLYDQLALFGYMQYWSGEMRLFFGKPERFWGRISRPGHPFSRHPLLSRHGLNLVCAAKERIAARCREKGIRRIPLLFSAQMLLLVVRIMIKERRHREDLVHLAKRATHEVWGIPYDRMDAAMTAAVWFGEPRKPTNIQSAYLRSSTAGLGGVLQSGEELRVVGRGWFWPILSHELVKATVELICMHGLNHLDAATYAQVLNAADRIEYEPWMLQVGPELWRQLLLLLPDDRPVAELIMHIACLPPPSLEALMLAVVEDKERARQWLANLGRERT